MMMNNNNEEKENNNNLFKQRHNQLCNLLTNKDYEYFRNLPTNGQKIQFVFSFYKKLKVKVKITGGIKSINDGIKEEKEEATQLFIKGNYGKSLRLFSQCIIKCPAHTKEYGELQSILLANRSACLYHLKYYEQALCDIERAIENHYPPHLLYKLYHRKAKCLLALNESDQAFKIMQLALQYLNCSNLNELRRNELHQEITNEMKLVTETHHQQVRVQTKGIINNNKIMLKTEDRARKEIRGVEIKSNQLFGRYASASRDIEIGEIILEEDPYCTVLLHRHKYTNCHHCLRNIIRAVACAKCDGVAFCSEQCRNTALASYHLYECRILPNLSAEGLSINCHLSFRMISQNNLQYLLKMKYSSLILAKAKAKAKVKAKGKQKKGKSLRQVENDYVEISKLVTHEKERTIQDMLHRIHMALFLLHCLHCSAYFEIGTSDGLKEQVFTNEEYSLTENDIYIGELLVQHLQLLQFNAHEIYHWVQDGYYTDFIAGGLYPTLALFNHSCNPGVVRYFNGRRVIVRAIRNIKSGELIAENYGAIYAEMKKEKRQELLKMQYWFDCTCEACNDDWPTKDIMRTRCNILTFPCSNQKCHNVISIDTQTSLTFIVTCQLCQRVTNTLSSLKTLQNTENKFIKAQDMLKEKKYTDALNEYLSIFRILDSILVAPFDDYYFCQQQIRKCYLICFGNNKLII